MRLYVILAIASENLNLPNHDTLIIPEPGLRQCDTEHETLTYIRTQERMDLIVAKGTPMIMKI